MKGDQYSDSPVIESSMRNVTLKVFILAGITLGFTTPGQAAPVTLQFDATIGTVFTGNPFDSGIVYQVGDVVSGSFSFEPDNGNGNMSYSTTQPFASSITINGIKLNAPSIEFKAVNNALAADFPLATVVDRLEFGVAGLYPEPPSVLPNLNAARSSWSIHLIGPADSVARASLPSNVAVWNSFNLWRQLRVTLRDGQGGAIGFQATVRPFLAIPEPSSLALFATWIGLFIVFNRWITPSQKRT